MSTWLRRTLFLLVLPFVPVVGDADDTEVKRLGSAQAQERGISGKWAGTGVNDGGAQSAVSLEITENEDGTLTGKGHGSPGKELKILNGERVTADVYQWEHATETYRWRVRCTVKGKSLVLDYTCTWKEDGKVKGGYGTVVLTRLATIAQEVLKPDDNRAKLRDALLEREKEGWELLKKKDLAALGDLYADDFVMISHTATRQSKREFLESARDLKLDSYEIEGTPDIVVLTPDAATLIYRVTYTAGGTKVTSLASSTYARRAGKWLLVFNQETAAK